MSAGRSCFALHHQPLPRPPCQPHPPPDHVAPRDHHPPSRSARGMMGDVVLPCGSAPRRAAARTTTPKPPPPRPGGEEGEPSRPAGRQQPRGNSRVDLSARPSRQARGHPAAPLPPAHYFSALAMCSRASLIFCAAISRPAGLAACPRAASHGAATGREGRGAGRQDRARLRRHTAHAPPPGRGRYGA